MRIDFELETTIRRPREAVFAFVTDPGNLSRWDTRVIEASVEDGGALRAGARIREVRKVGLRRVEQIVRVAEYEPPERFTLRIERGPIPVHGDFRFDDGPTGDATTLRLRAHGQAPGPPFMAPLVARLGRRTMRSQHERLKRLLEAQPADA